MGRNGLAEQNAFQRSFRVFWYVAATGAPRDIAAELKRTILVETLNKQVVTLSISAENREQLFQSVTIAAELCYLRSFAGYFAN